MNTAKRIRERRMELALSEAALAKELGVSLESHGDLEQHQDELARCVTLQQATQLSARLGIPLLELLSGRESSLPMPSPDQVAQQITLHLASTGCSLRSLEESASWELQAFLVEPLPVARCQPIMFFQDLAKVLNAAPLGLIPHLNVA
jgi:transcriptional regulator with XRE-family HTH domain